VTPRTTHIVSAPAVQSLYELGRRLFEQGDYAEAGLALTRCLRLIPGDRQVSYLLGLVALQSGQTDQAIAALRFVVERDDSDTLARLAHRHLAKINPESELGLVQRRRPRRRTRSLAS